MRKSLVKVVVPLAALWLAFCGVGLSIHHACKDAPVNHLGWTDGPGLRALPLG